MTARPPRHPERGLTLTELTVATLMASIVMIGLVGFYMNSQGVWMDSSGQALTQREATQLTEEVTQRSRGAAYLTLTPVSGDSLQDITFFSPGPGGTTTTARFWWRAADRRVHLELNGGGDAGPLEVSDVERFAFRANPDTSYVEFDIRMRSPEDQVVAVTSGIRLQNHH